MKLSVLVLALIAGSLGCHENKSFPSNFLWGAASSAYQIEGGWNASGKGVNIWDWFTHTYPEKIANGSNGDVAADSYHNYEEDVKLLANLGAKTYRFSLSWTRILPNATTDYINQAGVDYYLNLLELLKQNNIEPVVTLYHWDLPLVLHEIGGWTNPEISDYFADFTRVCYELFGSYVKHWITLNEPISTCYFGYEIGTFAPGISDEPGIAIYQCAYTHLLAHAKAYRIYNDTYKESQKGQVGITLVYWWYEPLNATDPDDIEAAERAVQFGLGLFAHPIFIGNWPQIMIDRIGYLSEKQGFNTSRLPAFTDDEIALIKGTYDFFGLNYYTTYLAYPRDTEAVENTTVSYGIDRAVSSTYVTDSSGSAVTDVPRGLREMVNWIANQYGNPPILITENGVDDTLVGDFVNDVDRITYIQGHVCSLLEAIQVDKVNVIGYTHWSLIDDFEWNSGYEIKYGLVGVDFSSAEKTRSPKHSYYVYQDIITSNCLKNCTFTTD